ncbi:phosphotransferase [Oceanimonas sp. NS1]|nr:phosphotransferase [Oceanimonas sp. NS1]
MPTGLEADAAELWSDRALKHKVAGLRLRFQCDAQALLHGDLHTGSVFVREGECRVFDAEFGFYGPMGFDVGLVVANLLLNFCGLPGWRQARAAEEARFARVEDIRALWKGFSEAFAAQAGGTQSPLLSEPGFVADFVQRVWQDTLGFAGTELIRRTIGVAHVADLDDIPDDDGREACQRRALWLGRRLIMEATTLSPLGLCSWLRRMAAEGGVKSRNQREQGGATTTVIPATVVIIPTASFVVIPTKVGIQKRGAGLWNCAASHMAPAFAGVTYYANRHGE